MTTAPPSAPKARPPVPGWMWLLFAAALLAAAAFLTALTGGYGLSQAWQSVLAWLATALVLALPFMGGLALAGRFFDGTAGRIVGGLIFTGLLTVGLGAVVCAGCMCLFPNALNLH